MACESFKEIKFRDQTLKLIYVLNSIIHDYAEQGFKLTVRQLYYQLVSKAMIENTERSYKNIASVINDARIAGLIDWGAIEDRTREFIKRQRWKSGKEILQAAANGYHMDMWKDQPQRVFVIIEKEALVGVLTGVCQSYDVPLLAARGYPSASVIYDFVKNDIMKSDCEEIKIIHLGDHDPSGIDMTRDLDERINLFCGVGRYININRIALNMDQIEELKPPPNPAKVEDSRFESYRSRFGRESWELDALRPDFIVKLVNDEIARQIDFERWDERLREIDSVKSKILKVSKKF